MENGSVSGGEVAGLIVAVFWAMHVAFTRQLDAVLAEETSTLAAEYRSDGPGELGDAIAQREASLEGLRSAHGFLQGCIASELRLKRTPALEFSYDDTTDRAMRVEAILDEIGPS